MNTENKVKEFLKSIFIIREGGAWSFGIMHSGLRYGTGRTPQAAVEISSLK